MAERSAWTAHRGLAEGRRDHATPALRRGKPARGWCTPLTLARLLVLGCLALALAGLVR